VASPICDLVASPTAYRIDGLAHFAFDSPLLDDHDLDRVRRATAGSPSPGFKSLRRAN
jgi:hypothetical protein